MSDNAIRQITADDLRTMNNQEGLILQGCGGDLREWLDGINGQLAEAGIWTETNLKWFLFSSTTVR